MQNLPAFGLGLLGSLRVPTLVTILAIHEMGIAFVKERQDSSMCI